MVIHRSEMLGPLAAVLALLILMVAPERRTDVPAVVPDAVLEFTSPGLAASWRIGDRSAFVTPSEAFQTADGLWCRHYRLFRPWLAKAAVNATACRLPDGEWLAQSELAPQVAATPQQ